MDTEHQWTRDELRRSLELLTLRERQIITLRFGLLDGQKQTVEEVSRAMQITRERVRQLEARAWHKLNNGGDDGEAGAFVKRR